MSDVFTVPAWYSQAACRGVGPANFFRPDLARKGPPRRWPGQETAMVFCEECPVAYECLSEALDRGEQHGVWGGFDLAYESKAAQHSRWEERQRAKRAQEEQGAA